MKMNFTFSTFLVSGLIILIWKKFFRSQFMYECIKKSWMKDFFFIFSVKIHLKLNEFLVKDYAFLLFMYINWKLLHEDWGIKKPWMCTWHSDLVLRKKRFFKIGCNCFAVVLSCTNSLWNLFDYDGWESILFIFEMNVCASNENFMNIFQVPTHLY